jgi:putative FmdB family regulatory protein
MPLYEFLCLKCGATDEVFMRTMQAEVRIPPCPNAGSEKDHTMRRRVSKFAQHKTMADQLVEAEAKYGKEVDAAMGAEPDVGRYAERYERLAKNLPGADDL